LKKALDSLQRDVQAPQNSVQPTRYSFLPLEKDVHAPQQSVQTFEAAGQSAPAPSLQVSALDLDSQEIHQVSFI